MIFRLLFIKKVFGGSEQAHAYSDEENKTYRSPLTHLVLNAFK